MAISEELTTTPETSRKPTHEQQSAVDAPLPTVTLACPGTGKTFTMIERIVKAHESDGIALENMFVATFSKYAANDMTKRLFERLEAAPEYIGTFHRNAIRLYKQYPQLMNLHGYVPQKIYFATTVSCEEIIERELEKNKKDIEKLSLKVRDVKIAFKSVIDYLKSIGIYPIDYHGYTAPKTLDHDLKEMIQKRLKATGEILFNTMKENDPIDVFWLIYTLYQEVLKQSNSLDYNDVIALPVFAMRDSSIKTTVASNFQLVVIDEFQDCSTMQFELIEQLSNNYQTAFLVGDEDQLLYEWRDANLEKVMSFYENKNFNVRVLQGNFRSQKPIIDLAINIITQNKKRYESKVMRPMRKVTEPNSVSFLQPYDERFEAYFVAQNIKSFLNGERPELGEVKASDIAIIFANRYYREHIEHALHNEKIDYNFVKGYGFYEYKEVANVLAYLSLALDHNNNMAFQRVINFPKRRNTFTFQSKIHSAAKQKNCSYFEALMNNKALFEKGTNKEFVQTIIDLGQLMQANKTPLEVIGYLEKKMNINEALSKEFGEEEAKDRHSRIDQLVFVLGELLQEFDTYEDAIEELWKDIYSVQKEVIEDKVQIMTAFGAKGLEFKIVFIIGAVNGNFPSYNEGSTRESGRRVFYVACTRAKDLLLISAPRYMYKSGTLVECMPTMFLDGLDSFYETIAVEKLSSWQMYQEAHEFEEPSEIKYVGALPEGFE